MSKFIIELTYFLYAQTPQRIRANEVQNCAKTPRRWAKLAATPSTARNELVNAKNVESSMAAMFPMAPTSDWMFSNAGRELSSAI